MISEHVAACCRALAEKKLTISFAESATAGRFASEFALSEQSGTILIGGIVCYNACLKQEILKVPEKIIKKFTPESAEVTEELAKRLKKLIDSDVYVAVTGLTTPGGSETPEKPVGTMFIQVNIKWSAHSLRHCFSGDPGEIILQTIDQTCKFISAEIKNC